MAPRTKKISYDKVDNFNKLVVNIETKGGEVLATSDEYTNAYGKLKVKCQDGHEFDASLNNSYLRQCPTCSSNIGEFICKSIADHLILDGNFQKVRPKWLPSPTGTKLEIDIYSDKYKLGLEFNGKQHYEYIPFFHGPTDEKFKKQQEIDTLKIKLCKENNVNLIVIPYTIPNVNLYDHIKTEFTKLGLELNNTPFDVSILKYKSNKEEVNKIVTERGGQVLSGDYLSRDSELELKCSLGHVWKTKIMYLCRSEAPWCHECALVRKSDTRKKISSGVIAVNNTEEGKIIKAKSQAKRSATMAIKKEECRNTIKEKICNGPLCNGILSPVGCFSLKSAAKDGLQTNCKKCVTIIKKENNIRRKVNSSSKIIPK